MIDYKKTIDDLRNADNLTADHKLLGICERAAYAIEVLQAEVDQWKAAVKGQEDGIKVLQAEVKRLKEANDELREAQTYIDHYGDRWMTSAKDVPTAAYEHGYADGRDEATAKLEVQDGTD